MPYASAARKMANARRYYLANRASFKRKAKAYCSSHRHEIKAMKQRWAAAANHGRANHISI